METVGIEINELFGNPMLINFLSTDKLFVPIAL